MNKSRSHAFLGLAISVPLIVLVATKVDVAGIGASLHRTDLFWVLIALVFYWAEILLRILRWKRIMASMDARIKYSSISNSFCVGAAANNIFPFRLGDILRVHLVGIQGNVSRYSLMGTIVLEKLLDVVAVLLLTCWGAFETLNRLGAMPRLWFVFVLGILGIMLVGAAYLIVKFSLLPRKALEFFHVRIMHFKRGFGALFRPKTISLALIETVVIWMFNTLAIWAIIKALGISLATSEVLLLEGLVGVAAAIPSAPAGIGTMQYAFLLTFDLLRLDISVGVAASLLVQSVLLGSITLVGAMIFALDIKSRRALRKIRHE